ncbi:hypothetical protein PNEG_02533 [Pneumocystis murina B123]|uniref:SH3 domain-containing protein n=1 Tax=Pneumocystis murina (strain B123) TaxID=1069680 RepID=M7NQ08_PNEMU|nr:hypothetical protein PNEG_02533 [Pneumocystis murina B123]EMR09196.1 hypothetical protein PNEG_02533 [Pneumocystis murina B123]
MFQVHKRSKHLPTLKRIFIGGIAALISKVFGKCISLSGSKSCPSFNTSSISTIANNTFPFLSLVNNVNEFDEQLESYIINYYTKNKYGNFYGCSMEDISDTNKFYARFTKTILCASVIQESIVACNLTAANSRPVCADTCAEWTSSEAFILQHYCTNRTLENDLSLIRFDFAVCTSPSASFSLECIKGKSNEPQSCGFGTNILGLCQYCNSSFSNSIDTCCALSNLSSCASLNYSISIPSLTDLIPTFTTPITSNTISSSSLPTIPINEQEKSNTAKLSQKTMSFIIILSIIIIIIILSLLILLIILSFNKRRKIRNTMSKLNSAKQPFIEEDPYKRNYLSLFRTENNSNTLNYNTLPIQKNSDYFNRTIITSTPEKELLSANNENKQVKSYKNFYNIADLNKNHKLYQNTTPSSLKFDSYKSLNHHASQITENNSESINTIALKNPKSRPTSSIGQDRVAILPIVMSMKDYYSDHQITRNTEVVALYIYEPKMPDEMILERGDIIHVVSVWDDGWCSGIKIGKLDNFNTKKNTFKNNIKYLQSTNKNVSKLETEIQIDELTIKAFPLVCVCHKDSWKDVIESDISPSSTLKSAPPNITRQIFNNSENNISSQLNKKNINFENTEDDIKIAKETRRKSFPEIWPINRLINSKFKEQFEIIPS